MFFFVQPLYHVSAFLVSILHMHLEVPIVCIVLHKTMHNDFFFFQKKKNLNKKIFSEQHFIGIGGKLENSELSSSIQYKLYQDNICPWPFPERKNKNKACALR